MPEMPEESWCMITTLLGKNQFLILESKKRIITDFLRLHGDLSVEEFDAQDSSETAIYDALSNLPFLVEKKLVVINNPASSKSLTEKLIDWLTGEDRGIDVLIVEANPDKRTAWYKFIVQNSKVVACEPLDERNMLTWAKKYSEDKGGVLEHSAGLGLIARVGLDQQMLANEIEKLINYDKNITESSVSLLIEPMPQDTVFSLLDALSEGDAERTMSLYDSLRLSGVDPSEILAMLGWQLHTIALVKSSMGRPASESGLHPFVIQKNTKVAKRLSMADIEKMVSLTSDAELSIKRDGQKSQNAVAVLLFTLVDILK